MDLSFILDESNHAIHKNVNQKITNGKFLLQKDQRKNNLQMHQNLVKQEKNLIHV